MFFRRKVIDTVYVGEVAYSYERKRERTNRWRIERQVVERLIAGIPWGSTVCDISAGMGRWLEKYNERGFTVKLIDASADMLMQANERAEALSQGKFEFEVSTVVRDGVLTDRHEYFIITNFVNWITLPDFNILLDNIRRSSLRHGFVMISYRNNDLGFVSRILFETGVVWRNIKSDLGFRDKGRYNIYNFNEIMAIFGDNRFIVIKEHTVRTGRRINSIFEVTKMA